MASREKELAVLPTGDDAPGLGLPRWLNLVIAPFRHGQQPAAQAATGFYTDTSVCIGCKACEVACKQWNQLPADGFHWTGNSHDNTGELSATSWRHVKFIEQFSEPGLSADPLSAGDPLASLTNNPAMPGRWLMMSDVCKHCETAPCQQACPTGSLIYNEFENVYIQPDICNGCSYCIAACPFGVITCSTFDGHAHKCTLCYDRQRDDLVPACAKACPTESIQFGPLDELRARAQHRVAELRERGVTEAYLYGGESTETYSGLHSFYLLLDKPSAYGLPDSPFNPWLHMPGDYTRAVCTGIVSAFVLLAVLLFGS